MSILITQRVDVIDNRNEVRDALDVAWYPTLSRIFPKERVIPVPNYMPAAVQLFEAEDVSLLILSGGNDLHSKVPAVRRRDEVERYLLQEAWDGKIKVLAICRGFQHMNEWLGGRLTTCAGHVRMTHQLFYKDGREAFRVNSFHNFCIHEEGMGKAMVSRLLCEDGSVEAATVADRNWLGVMWHPERGAVDEAAQDRFFLSTLGEYQ